MTKKKTGLTEGQQNAYDAVMRGEDIFLSGPAGTGKSFLLQKIIADLKGLGKNVLVTAPTGVAAINVHGSTCHRVFGWPNPTLAPEDYSPTKEIKEADVVVVDEISMARIDLYDRIDNMIRAADLARAEDGKPKIQVVMSGDFAQLPPVIAKDKKILETYFPQASSYFYAFEHPGWTYKTYNLSEVVRQESPEFAIALNKIRLGDPDGTGIEYINEHRAKKKIKEAISVLTTNKAVDAENDRRVASLPGTVVVFRAQSEGKVEKSDRNAPETITLKIGARVVALINDADKVYVNGSQGQVVGIDEYDKMVTVEFDNGEVVDFHPYKWEITEPEIIEQDGKSKLIQKTIGTYTQIPLKIAYAVTVHKSQGQTYGAENANPHVWDSGQLYTQLSRVTDVHNLYINRDLTSEDVIVSPEVVRFYGGNVADVSNTLTSDASNTPDHVKRSSEQTALEPAESEFTGMTVMEEPEFTVIDTEDNKEEEPKPTNKPRKKKSNSTTEIKKMNNDRTEEVKEVATPKTIRVTQSVFDELRETFDTIGAKNQTVGLKTILEGYKSACAINASTGTDQDALESVMTAVATITDEVRVLLDRKAQVQTAAELSVRTQMESKDKTISELQKKNEDLTKLCEDQKSKIAEMNPIVEKIERYQDERDKAILDADKAIADADQLKSKLTDTIASQSVQIKELQEDLENLPAIKEEKHQVERKCEKLQDKLDSRTEKIKGLEERIASLETDLGEEKELREKDQAESLLKAARQAEDARQEKEEAIEKAQEKESLRWQTQIEKLEANLAEERKAHNKVLEDLSRVKLEKEFKTDPEIESLKKTIEKLESELRETKSQKSQKTS